MRQSRRAWRRALLSASVAFMLAVAFNVWHAGLRREAARDRLSEQVEPFERALQRAVERRVSLITGLRSFADSRSSRTVLDEEFVVFATGSMLGMDGVRALQLVEDGRIVATWPVEGNEAALGLDLLSDPRPTIAPDVRRALASDQLTVTGPVELAQGGMGIIVRRRLAGRPGFPQLAAVVVDVPALLREAGIPAPNSAIRIEVRNPQGEWIGGDPAGSAIEPVLLPVQIPDGNWSLAVAPLAGWTAIVRAELWPYWLLSILLVLVAGLFGFLLGGHEDRLVREVTSSEHRLDLALRAGRMAVWEWELTTDTVRCSEAATAMLGYDPALVTDPIGVLFERVHPDDREDLQKALAPVLDGTRADYIAEFRMVNPSGPSRSILAIGESEPDAHGRPARLLGILSDVTEHRELEERLRHSQRIESVGKLAGGVAHDFNNLLTAIIGFGELAQDRAADVRDDDAAESIRADLDQLVATAKRGASVTSQLLAFSRRSPNTPALVDLSDAVRKVQPMLARLVGEQVLIRTDFAEALPHVLVDDSQLTQVVLNLLVNARDAMPDGGVVTLRTFLATAAEPHGAPDSPPEDWVVLEVRDEGTGMSAKVQARVFDPYFTTKEMGSGTGLGLAVVHGAVQEAGGHITVDSLEGRGTTFRVYFPLRPRHVGKDSRSVA